MHMGQNEWLKVQKYPYCQICPLPGCTINKERERREKMREKEKKKKKISPASVWWEN